MTRLRRFGKGLLKVIIGLTGLGLALLAEPVSVAVGGLLGILAGFGVILVGMFLVALIQ